MDIQTQKQQLIEAISSINSSQILTRLQGIVNNLEQSSKILLLAEKPRKTLNIDELKKEQNYTPKKVKNLYGQWFREDNYLDLIKLLD